MGLKRKKGGRFGKYSKQPTTAELAVNNAEAGQTALISKRDELKVPKSLIIRRGKTAHEVVELVNDLRHLMLPYTALKFKEDARNRKLKLAQYASHLGLPMGVTHISCFQQNKERLSMRLARLPAGPTLSFRVHRFSLNRQIKALQKRPMSYSQSLMSHPPIVVTNNFGANDVAPHIKLLRITFQNMFPAINVATVKLSSCRRVVLFNLLEEEIEEEVDVDGDDEKNNNNKNKDVDENENSDDSSDDGNEEDEDEKKKTSKKKKKHEKKSKDMESPAKKGKDGEKTTETKKVLRKRVRQLVEMRHYAIRATPAGVNRRIRRVIQAKLPNLSKCQDISDYLSGAVQSDAPSDSEAEDDPNNVVRLPSNYVGKGNKADGTSALKLVEMGPRLTLELFKVEKELGAGDVLYHAFIKKSPEEAAALKSKHESERRRKEEARSQQEANVERKRRALEEKREAKRRRKEERERKIMESLREGGAKEMDDDDENDESSEEEEEEMGDKEVKMNDLDDESESDSDNDDDDDNDDGSEGE